MDIYDAANGSFEGFDFLAVCEMACDLIFIVYGLLVNDVTFDVVIFYFENENIKCILL